LNEIEKIAIKKIIANSNPDVAIIDCIDVVPERFCNEIEKFAGIEVIAEHKADDKYVIVAAASIVAKVQRDLEIEKIRKKYQDVGSGYPSDPKTMEFLEGISYNDLPNFVRKSWATVKRNRED